MAAHHRAWLSVHPDRSYAWLRLRLDDGFDVHHVDSNTSNNDPYNLVLIESTDHLRLHGKFVMRNRKGPTRGRLTEAAIARRRNGQ